MNAWIHVFWLMPSARGQLEQRPQVVDVRVDATVGDEAEEMDVASPRGCAAKSAEQRLVREEGAILDRDVHAHQVLEEHAPRADREVPDLRVAHLARRQPDGSARRLQDGVRVPLPERVEDGRLGELDGVPGPGRSETPPVQDHERDELSHAPATAAAARQIASNDCASSEAPPTSAPSTSGCASSTRRVVRVHGASVEHAGVDAET